MAPELLGTWRLATLKVVIERDKLTLTHGSETKVWSRATCGETFFVPVRAGDRRRRSGFIHPSTSCTICWTDRRSFAVRRLQLPHIRVPEARRRTGFSRCAIRTAKMSTFV